MIRLGGLYLYKPSLVEVKGYVIMGLGFILMLSTQLFSSVFNNLNLNDPFQKSIASEWALVSFLGGFAVILVGLVSSWDMTKWHQEFPRSCSVCGSGMKPEEPYDIVTKGYAHQDKEVCNKQKREWRLLKPLVLGLLSSPVWILVFTVASSAGLLIGLGLGGLLGLSFYLSVWRERS